MCQGAAPPVTVDLAENPHQTGDRLGRRNSFNQVPAAVIGASPGALGTALAQQSLRGVLGFCNARQMTAPEAYIKYSTDIFTPPVPGGTGEVKAAPAIGCGSLVMRRSHGRDARDLSLQAAERIARMDDPAPATRSRPAADAVQDGAPIRPRMISSVVGAGCSSLPAELPSQLVSTIVDTWSRSTPARGSTVGSEN